MSAALSKFGAQVDTSKKTRKLKQRAVNRAVDGRSLRATGRTEHLNLRMIPETRDMIEEAAQALGIPKSVWVERAIIAACHRFKDGEE